MIKSNKNGRHNKTYKIYIESKFDGSLSRVWLDNKEEDALDDVINEFMTGTEVLELSGRDFSDPNDDKFKMKKV